jgi:hypothetical protein
LKKFIGVENPIPSDVVILDVLIPITLLFEFNNGPPELPSFIGASI